MVSMHALYQQVHGIDFRAFSLVVYEVDSPIVIDQVCHWNMLAKSEDKYPVSFASATSRAQANARSTPANFLYRMSTVSFLPCPAFYDDHGIPCSHKCHGQFIWCRGHYCRRSCLL